MQYILWICWIVKYKNKYNGKKNCVKKITQKATLTPIEYRGITQLVYCINLYFISYDIVVSGKN